MNQKLTEEIVYHILANLGVLPAAFTSSEKMQSLVDKKFLLPEKIVLEMEGGEIVRKNIFGCQISVTDAKDLKILLGDCTLSPELPEYCLVVQLKDMPIFGAYLCFTKLYDPEPTAVEEVDSEALIAVSVDKKNWMPCSGYLQATFLAGMEQTRDLGFGWSKCTKYQDQYQMLLSFIKFHRNFYGGNNEGQEVQS
jgi:hypothetical protein